MNGGYPSWLTEVLLGDEQLVSRLTEADDAGELDDDARLALRQFLDTRIREIADWPREQDYLTIAEELDRAGHLELASALQHVAGTSGLIRETRAQRAYRYLIRGRSARQDHLDDLDSRHVIDYSDEGPVTGIDGASYTAGYIHDGPDAGFVVAVRSDGMAELIGFGNYEAQRRWLADRGPAASGALDMPSAVPEPRVVLEERVLAALLADPRRLMPVTAQLPPDTFTAPARYEIYAAMLTVAAQHRRWYAADVAAQLSTRAARLPAEALREAGGEGAPWTHKYLQRLDQTAVDAAHIASAFRAVIAEDVTARQDPGLSQVIHGRIKQIPAARPEHMPDLERWLQHRAEQRITHSLLPPPDRPAQGGPVPRL